MLDPGRFPRATLLDGRTPIRRLDRLEACLGEALGGVRLFVKRDDLGPVGGGGNKLRKLEFLLGEALAQGADTVITVGALQSNHARLTAAAAARCGLACELFLTRTVPRHDPDYEGNGNRLLFDLFGARVHPLPGDADALAAAEERAGVLRRQGRGVQVFPSGGSNALGCLGYAACAAEILDQAAEGGIAFAEVVVPNGSSGTHAGLAAGFLACGQDPRRVGSHTVLAPEATARETTLGKARETLRLLDRGDVLDAQSIRVSGAHRGPGYGIPTEAMLEAVRLLARTEGLLLDPVYGGKAFAGLLHDLRNGAYRPGDAVLFLMTGGVPGLFAYRETFTGREGDRAITSGTTASAVAAAATAAQRGPAASPSGP